MLAVALRDLATNNSDPADPYLVALKNLRDLAARIGDNSNLTLDPVLDTYHVGYIVVSRLPTVLEELGQAQLLIRTPNAANEAVVDRKARLIALDTLLRANIEGTINDVRIAQRGDPDGRLKQSVDPAIASFATSVSAYLDTLHAFIDTGAESARQPDLSYASAVNSALDAWDITQKQLDQLLTQRIEDLGRQRLLSFVLIGALGTLGLLVAFLTYRDMIVRSSGSLIWRTLSARLKITACGLNMKAEMKSGGWQLHLTKCSPNLRPRVSGKSWAKLK